MKSTKLLLIPLLILGGFTDNIYSQVLVGTTEIDTTTLVSGLDTPWEILWGPDDQIWITERKGTISRLNPETGELTELITIADVYENNEAGLLGMVLHPDFENYPYVFVVYNYLGTSGAEERLQRFTYSDGVLGSPLTLLEGIDGAGNHNGSRLVIDADQKLYMTTGDAADTSLPQDLNSLNGKVLRMNLDGSIPEDNPYTDSYVWTLGHRNPQGLVISPLGVMYSSEHGPSSNDEMNIIERGRNYGWPNVYGFCDEAGETQFCVDSSVMEPIAAWTPTLAVAGTDFYEHTAIPEWQNSVLVTSLKASSLVVLKLSPDGRSVISEDIFFSYWWGRLRDICISPDGRIFLAVSNRDGRGTIRAGDDRIVELESLHTNAYCTREMEGSICPGESYPFYGRELSQPGIYSDTILNPNGCDTIVSLVLSFFDLESTGLEASVLMATDDTVTLTANEGFVSYEWNNDPSLETNLLTIYASQLGPGNYSYTLRVEDVNGCFQSDTVEVVVSPALSIPESGLLEFSVYPNPVSGNEINIEYSITAEARLMIFSQDGKEVYKYDLVPGSRKFKVQLPGTNGLYNLVLSNEEEIRYFKILKL